MSAGELGRRHGLEQVGFWRKILEHPSYDAFWRDQAVDKILAAQPLKVPVMLVHSLWDQEDIYGAPAVYKAIEPKDTRNDMVFLVMGPWHHGQEIADGSALGALKFGSDTALHFRREILRPFLDQYLKDGAPKADVAPVSAFETGTNTWRRLHRLARRLRERLHGPKPTPLHLGAGPEARLHAARGRATPPFDEYVSDPAKPVPFRARPIQPIGLRQRAHLVAVAGRRSARGLRPSRRARLHLRRPDRAGEDQRRADREPRRLHHRHRFRLGGEADRRLSGRGAPDSQRMGGYQLMVSADIFRGRYRESLEKPARHRGRRAPRATASRCRRRTTSSCPATGSWCRSSRAGSPSTTATRRPSCRTSSGRRPRTIARPSQRIHHAPGQASFVELPLVSAP